MDKRKNMQNNVDPVDHEEKIIRSSEDYVTDNPLLKDRSSSANDIMSQNSKMVSAEIDRDRESADDLKDQGC